MTLLRVLIIATTLIGVIYSKNLDRHEPLRPVEEIDLEYRPWEHNETSTIWISLDGMGIRTLTSMFRLHIPNLKWLVMDHNEISGIPSQAFKFFPNLTYLSLKGNRIRQFNSDAFRYLEELEVLDLDANPISFNLDDYIFDPLTGLKRLYLRNCQMRSFRLPLHVDNLSHLYLSENSLQMFYAINESALTHLHLNDNQFWYVSLSQLKSLTYLNLSNNWLTRIMRKSEVPAAYYARTFIRREYLNGEFYQPYHGFLSEDDSGLFLDDASALQRLIVSSNKLSEIDPDAFLDTESLIYVDLSNNEITEVSAGTFNNLLQLESILLDSNRIGQINHRAFVNLPNLKTISLKNNRIVDMDEDAFTQLNSSANELYLYLDYNLIHTLRRGSFEDIKGLKHIGLSNNGIKTISAHAFVNLPNLESIVIENQSPAWSLEDSDDREVSGSMWRPSSGKRSIGSDAFFNLSSLASITIRGNLFSDIEARAFHTLPKLTSLDLSNNRIATLSATAFYDLPAIENLYLGKNSISKIEPGTFPKQLKHLDLTSNLVCPNFSCWHTEELHQLETLDVSGIIERFKVDDFTGLPKNLTVIVGSTNTTSAAPVCPY